MNQKNPEMRPQFSVLLMLAFLCSLAFGSNNTVTWTTYIDNACTALCPATDTADCSTTVDLTSTCNRNSESSQNNVTCSADKITYTNFPNTGTSYAGTEGCDANMTSFLNELPVGVCTEFPGPVPTWKLIVAATYTCNGSSSGTTAAGATSTTAAAGSTTPASTTAAAGSTTAASTTAAAAASSTTTSTSTGSIFESGNGASYVSAAALGLATMVLTVF